MTFLRVVFTGFFCVLLVVPAWCGGGRSAEHRQGDSATSYGVSGASDNLGGGTNKTPDCKVSAHAGSNCHDGRGQGVCKCQQASKSWDDKSCPNNNVGCSFRQCNNGLNLNYVQLRTNGNCPYAGTKKQIVTVADDAEEYQIYNGAEVTICSSKGTCGTRPSCKDGQIAPKLKLSDGKIVFAGCFDVSKFNRKCSSGQIFESSTSTKCVPCRACEPTNANCELTGSNGVDKCEYATSCKDGFENLQNEDKYNPSCSAIPVAAPVMPVMPTCTGTQILVDGVCQDCPACVKHDGTICELYVENNTCKYKISCEDGYGDPINNNGTKDGACTKNKPNTFTISYELNGGAGCDDAPKSYTAGTGATVNCMPQKAGDVFGGWTLNGVSVDMPYTISGDATGNKTFVASWDRAECSEEEKAKFPHADQFKFEKGVCLPTHCERGYKLNGDECIDDGIDEAQDKYKDAKERETSFANRMLGGATMAATGIGGMELAQGLAEQKADEAADRDMQAYMATFQCKIGNKGGKTYTGGTKGIETPGANQLINLYQEYVDLAADLKQRKEDLGLRPGVESEVVLDKAKMGLYSDEAMIEKRNGTYASIYRAATGNETDAEKLASERDKSAKRVDVGGKVAAGGVVGGVAGNVLLNHVNGGKLGAGDSNIKLDSNTLTQGANAVKKLLKK